MPTETFTFAEGADAEAHAVVERGLIEYNARAVGPYRYEDFQLYARDRGGEVVGGMFGASGMDWLYVDYLWVAETTRGSGLGSALLARAEAEAKRRGCVGVYLYTYGFQAPDFYLAHGFAVVGTIEDCPVGSRKVYLCKRV